MRWSYLNPWNCKRGGVQKFDASVLETGAAVRLP
jgi:hypothetical protein